MEHLTVPGTLLGRASSFLSMIQAFQTRTLRHRKVSYFLQGHSVTETEIGSRSAQLQSPHIILPHYAMLSLRIPGGIFHLVWKKILPSLPGFSKGDISFLTEDYLPPVNDQFPARPSLPVSASPNSYMEGEVLFFNQGPHCVEWLGNDPYTHTHAYIHTRTPVPLEPVHWTQGSQGKLDLGAGPLGWYQDTTL